ncbi:MAG: extracellular solute-binding protein, partial [Ruminococcus sp.]|nr:extracellular solute-binding protein [Ruminococcus sp.]
NKDTNAPAPSLSESDTDNNETPLTVATAIDLSQVKNEIIKKMSCDVDIKYYPYSEETDPFELLYLDMISGETPDVVYSLSGDITKLVKKGYMTDMYQLMEQSENLKKEDFLPNVLEGLDVNGKLPAICNDWSLLTAAAKTENVGDNTENWTPAQAIKAFNNMPEDMNFLYYEWRDYDRENYFIKRVAVDAVDYNNNTCDFGGAFMEMLGNVNNFSPFQTQQIDNEALINNHALVEEVHLFGINNVVAQSLYSYFGGADITFVGYPSETGKGYITDSFSMMGILETSQHKQQGYEFIDLVINDSLINTSMMYSMPITEKQLTAQLNESKYNNLSVYCPQYLPNSDEQVEISEEALQKVVDYIRNVEFEPYTSDTVENIVWEEYHKCFAGETTPQECADILDNRVSIYLSESE